MKFVWPFVAALCLASSCRAASQLVREEDGLRRDWLVAMHANWQDSSEICLAKRDEDVFVRAYVLPSTVTLDDLMRINMSVDFDELLKISDVALTYDRITNKSRLYASKPGSALPEQLQKALPGPGTKPGEAADRSCRERQGFSVGQRHDGQLRNLVAEHLETVDGGHTVYRLDDKSHPLPVEAVTEQGPQWRIKFNLGGRKTTANDLVEQGKALVRSVVGPDVKAQEEMRQVRPSPFLSGLVENAWNWELTTLEGDSLLVVVDWRAPRTADDDSAIVPEWASATVIVVKRWRSPGDGE